MTEEEAADEVAGKRLAENLWGTDRTSEFLGVSVGQLHQWRSRGGGPRSYKVDTKVKYDPDLRIFLLGKASPP